MKIDLSRILHAGEDSISVEEDFWPEPGELSPVVHRIESPLHVSGTVHNIRDVLSFEGEITGSYIALCARCNRETTVELRCSFDEVLYRSETEVPSDGILVKNDAADIDDAMLSAVILSLPMQVLCEEDCKGLCPHCGVDLNIKSCDCADDGADERLLVLKKLLEKTQQER